MQTETVKRTRLLSVRLTPKEYADLETRAHQAALEISALVRKIILDAPVPPQAKRRAPDIAALGRILAALNKIGGNINQIAKHANTTGNLVAYMNAQDDRERLAEAARAVMDALENP